MNQKKVIIMFSLIGIAFIIFAISFPSCKVKEFKISTQEIDSNVRKILGGEFKKVQFKNTYPLGIAGDEYLYAQENKDDSNILELDYINSNSKIHKLNLNDLSINEYNINMICPTCSNYIVNSDSILFIDFQLGTTLLDIKNENIVNYTGSSELTDLNLYYNGHIVRSSVYGFSIYNVNGKEEKSFKQKNGINAHRKAVNIENNLFLFGFSERDSIGNEINSVYCIDMNDNYKVLWKKIIAHHVIKEVKIQKKKIYYLIESNNENNNTDFFSEIIVIDLKGNMINKLRMSAIRDFEFLENNDIVLSFDRRGLMCVSENLDKIRWSHQYSYYHDNQRLYDDIHLSNDNNIITTYSTDERGIYSYDIIDSKDGSTIHNFEMKSINFISKDVILYKENYNEENQTLYIRNN